MAKVGEIDKIKKLTSTEVAHGLRRPFSEQDCPRYFAQFGTVMHLLPKPPGRVLDLGCGMGWTSQFLAQRGYDVLGVDLCADAIDLARQQRGRQNNLQFLVSDYEDLPFANEFDGVVFFDSLHHAVDEETALRAAYEALKPGGILVASEPGEGHHQSPEALTAIHRFGVTEKDMPPRHIVALGQRLGFREWRIFPHAFDVQRQLYRKPGESTEVHHRLPRWLKSLFLPLAMRLLGIRTGGFPSRLDAYYYLRLHISLLNDAPRTGGITVLRK